MDEVPVIGLLLGLKGHDCIVIETPQGEIRLYRGTKEHRTLRIVAPPGFNIRKERASQNPKKQEGA